MRAPRTTVPLPRKDSSQMQIVDHGRIRLHREARGISLRKLAEVCGNCTYQAISNWENGKTRSIPEDTARMLSLVLSFPMASVFRPVEGFVVPEPSDVPGDTVKVAS